MGSLTTHVLDTSRGLPARGMRLDLFRFETAGWRLLKSFVTGDDGRSSEPLLAADDFVVGRYRIDFHVGAYFRAMLASLPDPPFLDDVPIHIGIADPGSHYHVPLLCSPWSYATYRGS
jgi:5-hydroxyisourate hydrolase